MLSNLSSPDQQLEKDVSEIVSHHENAKGTSRGLAPLEPVHTPVKYVPGEHNGTVTLLYELYQEKFSIKDGTITERDINDTYGLSEVMPNCRLRLSTSCPAEIREQIISVTDSAQHSTAVVYVPEQPEGTYCTLQNDHSYYVYVNQDIKQLEKEQAERGRVNQERLDNKNPGEHEIERDDGRGFDSCTCIYGTPCVVSMFYFYIS
jgi:hypothetical protein